MEETNEIIYLAGQISANAIESYGWRDRFIKYFEENYPDEMYNYELQIINPCDNKFNKSIISSSNSDFDYKKMPYRKDKVNVLPSKDYTYVKKSTIGIVNLNTYDTSKQIIGTIFELAWYYTMPEKTVLGIYSGDLDDLICKHPFIWQTVDAWHKDEVEAANTIERFFI